MTDPSPSGMVKSTKSIFQKKKIRRNITSLPALRLVKLAEDAREEFDNERKPINCRPVAVSNSIESLE